MAKSPQTTYQGQVGSGVAEKHCSQKNLMKYLRQNNYIQQMVTKTRNYEDRTVKYVRRVWNDSFPEGRPNLE